MMLWKNKSVWPWPVWSWKEVPPQVLLPHQLPCAALTHLWGLGQWLLFMLTVPGSKWAGTQVKPELLSHPTFSSPLHYFISVFRKKQCQHLIWGTCLCKSHLEEPNSSPPSPWWGTFSLASPTSLCYLDQSVTGFTHPLRGRAEDTSAPTTSGKTNIYEAQSWLQ